MPILHYSFPLTPPRAAPAQEHAYPDFSLELPSRWRPIPTEEENTLSFQSDADGAVIIISADYFDIPDDRAEALAQQCLDARIEAHRQAGEGPATVLQQGIRPHTSGLGLEMSYAAETEGGPVHLYLGYVTSRKVLNFSMVCQPGKDEAVALFNATVPGFRPRLP